LLEFSPDSSEKISHREFEEIVAELFKGFGYSVELTKRTRDGGRDVIAINRNKVIIPQKYLIECKHWKDKVGISVVRELLGVSAIEEERPSGLIIASTSGFTKDALLLSEKDQTKWVLSLKDKEAIEEWVKNYVDKKIDLP
jgi:HJR/Mrr/RecB family endonuclease